MTRRLLAGLAVLGMTTIALVQLDSIAAVVAWEVAVAAAVAVVAWRNWPSHPERMGFLFGGMGGVRLQQPHTLTPLELEVSAALDPTLAGGPVLRRRLLGLLRHRAGLSDGPVDDSDGRRLVGDRAWEALSAPGPLEISEIEHLVEKVEDL